MLAVLAATLLLQSDALVTGFRNPPASARPHTWWHWMDGNITKEGITADLEAMKQAGIGGAHIFDVGQGVPSGPIVYNSPEWRDLFAHAIHEATRLGLEMTVHNCAGWSSSGGPWVQPKDAMKKVVWAKVEFEGPKQFTEPIPKPPAVRGFYEDIQVVAFRTPAKPPLPPHPLGHLTGLDSNPGRVEKLNWPVIDSKDLKVIPLESIQPDGTINYTFGPGNWTILRMGCTLTGAQNVASRENGRGLEVDKLSADSLNAFFEGGPQKYIERVLPPFKPQEAAKAKSLTTVLVDSYETGYSNWSTSGYLVSGFPAKFGYDLKPLLPALAGYAIDNEAKTLGFLFDFRRNIADTWATVYSDMFAERLKTYHLQLAIEPYGNGNFDPFTIARPAGLIMGEYWVGDSQINPSVKHSSSIAHVYGHSVVGAEALTAMPQQAGWRNQPRQWKPFADQAMTLGINRIIYHRFAHQPWVKDVLPGMTMGPWGSHVDRTNTIWPYMRDWNSYVSRCQYMLQSGTFVGDVLRFSGEDSPQSYAGEGQDLPEVPAGYDFDYCGLDPLMSLQVKSGKLVLPSGGTYSVLVLPNTKLMSLRLARKVRELVEAGATVIGYKPTRSPSLSEVGANGELAKIGSAVWGISTAPSGSHAFGRGRVYWGKTVAEILSAQKVSPDFTTDARNVRAIHRQLGDRDIYFVASSEGFPRTAICRFRTRSNVVPHVQLWNPETGTIIDAPVWKSRRLPGEKWQIEVPINFEADGATFVILQSPSPFPGGGVRGEGPSNRHIEQITGTFPAETAKPKPPLRILKAAYGDEGSGQMKDVTKLLANAANTHSLRIGATNADMGGDPAPMIVKKLIVTYEQGGITKTVSIPENARLEIGDLPDSSTPPSFEVRTKHFYAWRNGTYTVILSDGKSTKIPVQDVPVATPVTGAWRASFPPGWDAPPMVTFDKLTSWSEHPDFGVKHFSGTVRYAKAFNVPASLLGKGNRLMLDLGDVRELCRVRLNGKMIATLWKPPFRIDITDVARAGANALDVEVTNLWVNRLIGDEQFPDDMGWNGSQLSGWPAWFVKGEPRPEPRRRTFTTWRHNFKDTPLLPSGLLGPVLLRPIKVIPLK